MKTLNKSLSRVARSMTAALLLSGAGQVWAQYASPVGTWDCVVSGREKGVAYLTFADDYTIRGYEVLTPKNLGTSTNENARGADDIGRTIDSTVSESKTNFSGFALISGYWSHESSGKKILGFYTEGNYSQTCTTNQAITESTTTEILDNGDGTYTTNLTTYYITNDVTTCEITGLTNGLSFSAIVRPGSRLSLKATSINGNKTLKGVPATEIADLSGFYYAQGKKSGVKYVEFFEAEASADYANGFDITGSGAGYELYGRALASRQKKLGLFYVRTSEDNPSVSLFGPINYSTYKANLKGWDGNGAKVTYKVTPQYDSD